MPVRLYGRYRAPGSAKITLSGKINDTPLSKTVDIPFPKEDPANPQIERMWAWHRVQRLLKEADAQGDRKGVLDEIIRLGEGYSIATEYTSFLVLENDAEFARWKINRRNLLRLERDRRSQEALAAGLEAIRSKAKADLGPAAVEDPKLASALPQARPGAQNAMPAQSAPANANAPARNQSRDFDTSFIRGGHAIDPISGAIALALRMTPTRDRDRIPRPAIILVALGPLRYCFPAVAPWLEWDRSAIAAGQFWRLLTGHWVHWSFEHLFWSGGAFILPALVCQRIAPRRFMACVLISAIAISAAVFLTNISMARGLSGIDSALFTLLAVVVARDAIATREPGRAVAAGALLIALASKILYESVTGRAFFVQGDASVMVVPLAHAVGAAVGVLLGAIRGFRLPIRLDFRKMHANGGVCRSGFWSLRTKKISRSSWPRSSECAA